MKNLSFDQHNSDCTCRISGHANFCVDLFLQVIGPEIHWNSLIYSWVEPWTHTVSALNAALTAKFQLNSNTWKKFKQNATRP